MSQSTQCLTCKHYLGLWECKAFTEIPYKIVSGEHDHRKPFKGDKGIHWEPANDEAAALEEVESGE